MKIKKLIFNLSFLLFWATASVSANNIKSVDGEVDYFDDQGNQIGTLQPNQLPTETPIPVLENDEVNGRVKVKLVDGRVVWLDNINLDLERENEVILDCKSVKTGKHSSTTIAMNMGFGNCKDVK